MSLGAGRGHTRCQQLSARLCAESQPEQRNAERLFPVSSSAQRAAGTRLPHQPEDLPCRRSPGKGMESSDELAEPCSCWGCTISSWPRVNLQESARQDRGAWGRISLLARSWQAHPHQVGMSSPLPCSSGDVLAPTSVVLTPDLFPLLPFPLICKTHVKGQNAPAQGTISAGSHSSHGVT